jgi:AcrR family transcriptional regulator
MSPRPARIDRRELLIQAGVQAFAHQSYEDVSTESVAQNAGVAQGLLFHYFGTKREFFLEVMRRINAEHEAAYASNRHRHPARWLRKEIELFLAGIVEHPPVRMTAGYAFDADIRAMMEQAQDNAVRRLTERMGVAEPSPLLSGALYGWVAFTFAAGSRWVESAAVRKAQMVALIAAALRAALAQVAQAEPAAGIDPGFFGEPGAVDSHSRPRRA